MIFRGIQPLVSSVNGVEWCIIIVTLQFAFSHILYLIWFNFDIIQETAKPHIDCNYTLTSMRMRVM